MAIELLRPARAWNMPSSYSTNHRRAGLCLLLYPRHRLGAEGRLIVLSGALTAGVCGTSCPIAALHMAQMMELWPVQRQMFHWWPTIVNLFKRGE